MMPDTQNGVASDELLGRIADVLKAMADPTRLKILHTLYSDERCVSSILDEVGSSQANVSKHLTVLKKAGLVASRREGTNVYYRIIDPGVFTICRSICSSIEERAGQVHRTIIEGRQLIELGEETGKQPVE